MPHGSSCPPHETSSPQVSQAQTDQSQWLLSAATYYYAIIKIFNWLIRDNHKLVNYNKGFYLH